MSVPQTRAADTPVDWYTPPELFAALGLDFDLDPCAPPLPAADWIPARRRISLPQDGLAIDWQSYALAPPPPKPSILTQTEAATWPKERIWCNPPYGEQTGKWVGKLAAHGRGIALVYVRSDTRWWQLCAAAAHAVCFIAGRVDFVPAHRNDVTKNVAPSCLLAYGADCAEALHKSGLGLTVDTNSEARRDLDRHLQGAFC